MTRKMIAPLLFGLIGAAILAWLGTWQLDRLEWKTAILADLETKIAAAPIALPPDPDPAAQNYVAVTVSGRLAGPELHVLTSRKPEGPGFRVIRALDTGEGRILVDLGYIPEVAKSTARPDLTIAITGNLIWPNETDGFTPEPNLDRNIWFARETTSMAKALGTRPVMVAVRGATPETGASPMPVTVNIANDHLEYAITWFSLMLVWIGMTGFLLWRIKRADI